jgi:transcription initiation factor TFIIIB Brf1 subunit/transcription initiation factor TFIIB
MLPLNESNKRKELNTIINIAQNNGYKKDDILKLYNRLKYQQNNQENNTKMEQNWVTITYKGNYICKITKLFKDAHLTAAFKSATTVGKLLSDTRTKNTYKQSGIYKMTCQSCHKVYIGQMG